MDDDDEEEDEEEEDEMEEEEEEEADIKSSCFLFFHSPPLVLSANSTVLCHDPAKCKTSAMRCRSLVSILACILSLKTVFLFIAARILGKVLVSMHNKCNSCNRSNPLS